MESLRPTPDAIRAQVRLMVASATFNGAQRAIRLLSWVVDETLAGRAAGIKDYTVGADGLGRGPRFDPRTDATARVEAHRLRTRIDLYYAKEGVTDPVRISLPKGSYVPVFAAWAPPPTPATAQPRQLISRRLAVAGGAVSIMVGAALYPWRPSTRSVTSHYTASEEAQRLYEQGVNYLRKPTQRGIDSAIDHLGKAIEHDPLFAVAHVKLANSLILKSVEIGPDPLMRRAKDLVDHAIEIDDMLAEGYALRGFIAWIHDLDLAAAERALDSAIGLDADSAEAHYTLARVLADTGRFLDALSHARQAAKNEPLSPYNRKRVPYVLYLEGRYNDAINAYLDLIALDSDFIQTQRELGLVYQEKRMFKEALAQFQRVQAMPSNYSPTMTRADIAQLHAVAGNHNEAERMLDALLEQAKSAFVSPYDIAVIYAGLGRQDAALNWLESAVIVRPFWLSLIKVDPRLESLRAGPRYAGMIQKLRL